MQAQRRIVVGVDGSDCSEIALRWAADEAEYRGATLVVVTTWTALPPPIVDPYAGFSARGPGDPREAAMSALGEMVGRVFIVSSRAFEYLRESLLEMRGDRILFAHAFAHLVRAVAHEADRGGKLRLIERRL